MRYKLLSNFISKLPKEAINVTDNTQINVGDYVKIGVEHKEFTEKFWATVEEISSISDRILVRINQDLLLTRYHGLKDNDVLVIERTNISGLIKADSI